MKWFLTGVMGLIGLLMVANCTESSVGVRSFDLAVEFQGISHLVSARVLHPNDFWVFFPKIDDQARQRLASNMADHEPRLYLPLDDVTTSGVQATRTSECPKDWTECQFVSLQGLDVRIEGTDAPRGQPPLSMDWSDPSDGNKTSLRLIPDFVDLTRRSLDGAEPPPTRDTFAVLQRVPLEDERLAARFRGTAGHVRTAQIWEGNFRPGNEVESFDPFSTKIARSFQVVAPVTGSATFRLSHLRSQQSAGEIRIASAGSPVRVVFDHAPQVGHVAAGKTCDHLKSHYLLVNLPAELKGEELLILQPANNLTPTACDANCSPGCSEPRP